MCLLGIPHPVVTTRHHLGCGYRSPTAGRTDQKNAECSDIPYMIISGSVTKIVKIMEVFTERLETGQSMLPPSGRSKQWSWLLLLKIVGSYTLVVFVDCGERILVAGIVQVTTVEGA